MWIVTGVEELNQEVAMKLAIAKRKVSKALVVESSQLKELSCEQIFHKGAAKDAKFGTNFWPTYVASPRKEQSFSFDWGIGVSLIASTLESEGETPLSVSEWPRNSTEEDANVHLGCRNWFATIGFPKKLLKPVQFSNFKYLLKNPGLKSE